MIDATSPASGSTPDAESTSRVNPEPNNTAEHGVADGFGASAPPSFGGASSRPTWPGVARPAGWFLSATGEAAPPARPGAEPVRPDAAGPDALGPDDPDEDSGQPDGVPGTDAKDSGDARDGLDKPADAWHPVPQPPVVGPTAALQGQPGGPGFMPPAGAVPGLYDPAHRSSWQLAQEVWRNSGISWEQPGWDELPSDDLPGQGRPAKDQGQPSAWRGDRQTPGPIQIREPARQGRTAGTARPAGTARAVQAPPPAFTRMPLGAPTMADAPNTARPMPPAYAEEMYRAWQGSVRAASASARPEMTAGRRHHTWQVLRVGVPVAVIVAVGAGALMMLTGKTNEMLADRSDQNKSVPGAGSSAADRFSEQGDPQAGTFSGYPGQRGTVLVNSIASAGATQLAVGSADGHPAIWHRGRGGGWSLVSAAAAAVQARPGAEDLTSVAYGPAGWIAVGDVVSGAAQYPVILTSADGVTWRVIGDGALAGPGSYVSGVAASKNGYVIVGRQVDGRRTFAAMWWSADLRNWILGDNGGLDGRLFSSQANAVTATAAGWVTVGTHGDSPMVWTSADGQHWKASDMPVPEGASTAFVRMVTVNGGARVVAGGDAVTYAGNIPIVMLSEDGGQHWRQIVLSAPDGLGTVTALTAAGTGFVAAGQAGPNGAQHAVTWNSPDGISWSAATPVGGGADQVTALAASGSTVTGSTVTGSTGRGASPAVLTLPAP
jgi:hypothetical protein